MNLIERNRELLASNIYDNADTRQMLQISSLAEPNDYDLYLITCCMCNYDIPDRNEVKDLRLKYFNITNGSIEGYEHKLSDYNRSVRTNIICKNTGNVNKFGLYEYEINSKDRQLIADLWSGKETECLKYVDNKTHATKTIVSINKLQLNNFIELLDTLLIKYDEKNIKAGIVFNNTSENKLIDISKLSLPFTPYQFQLEDAEKIIKTKRVLLGHEMGCFIGTTKVCLADGSQVNINDLVNAKPFLVNSYDTDTNRFVSKYAIAKKTRHNAELVKVKYRTTSTINNDIFDICCTPDHKFLVNLNNDMTWIEAKNLQTSMKLVSENNQVEIADIELLTNKEDVYCLTVNDTHNFAIDNGIIVHNCGKTFISILVGASIGTEEHVIYTTTDKLNYTDIVITDKGPLPIGKIVEENINCKVQVTKNGVTKFANILDRKVYDL